MTNDDLDFLDPVVYDRATEKIRRGALLTPDEIRVIALLHGSDGVARARAAETSREARRATTEHATSAVDSFPPSPPAPPAPRDLAGLVVQTIKRAVGPVVDRVAVLEIELRELRAEVERLRR